MVKCIEDDRIEGTVGQAQYRIFEGISQDSTTAIASGRAWEVIEVGRLHFVIFSLDNRNVTMYIGCVLAQGVKSSHKILPVPSAVSPNVLFLLIVERMYEFICKK